MKLSDIMTRRGNKKKPIRKETSHSLLLYQDESGEVQERIFNGTNLPPPTHVYTLNGIKLNYVEVVPGYVNIPAYSPTPGDRVLTYKDPQKFIRERKGAAKLAWEHNFNECQKLYNDFEEYFAVVCRFQDKKRFDLVTVEDFEVKDEWI